MERDAARGDGTRGGLQPLPGARERETPAAAIVAVDVLHNQRLTFLGSAVLKLIATHHLFVLMPTADEGGLTDARTALTNNRLVAHLAMRLGLHGLLLHHLPSADASRTGTGTGTGTGPVPVPGSVAGSRHSSNRSRGEHKNIFTTHAWAEDSLRRMHAPHGMQDQVSNARIAAKSLLGVWVRAAA